MRLRTSPRPLVPTKKLSGGASRASTGRRCWQRVEHRLREAAAGVPDLERDDLVGGCVVIDQAPTDLFADDVLGMTGGEPSDVGVTVVVSVSNVHGDENSVLKAGGLCIANLPQKPCADDPDSGLVTVDRVVVDDLEPTAVRRRALDTPVGISSVDLPRIMSVADRLFDVLVCQVALEEPEVDMQRPEEAVDRHRAGSLRAWSVDAMLRSVRPLRCFSRSSHCRSGAKALRSSDLCVYETAHRDKGRARR
jgi:hypothetical protein